MIFNLIPIPPLDGSKIILVFLPDRLKYYFYRFEQYGLFLLLILIAGGFFGFLSKLVDLFFYLIAGF
jgi:Zn-dependent protease